MDLDIVRISNEGMTYLAPAAVSLGARIAPSSGPTGGALDIKKILPRAKREVSTENPFSAARGDIQSTTPRLEHLSKQAWRLARHSRRLLLAETSDMHLPSTSDAVISATMPSTSSARKRRKLIGRAFYESLGSPNMVLAPMVDQSEFVRFAWFFSWKIRLMLC